MEENKGFNIKYLVIGILFTLQTIGIYEHILNLNPNLCEMTYMYQNPEYIPVELPKSVTSQFPQYGLYSYGEGIQASQLYAGKYSGQPVLFVPGNGGSYKQVRSLASVAYRKSMDDDETRHFDFFTADLAEDLGAFYGPALEEQTSFITAVLPVIQHLYHQKKPVILIGHSMGGLVSRAVLLSESVNSSDVPLLVTLASPHAAPPISLDPYIAYFYDKVQSYWSLEGDLSGAVANIALVNVGGGRNDVQVSPLAIALPHAHVTTVTTAVPGCWATTDHLSIVWCKQLVLAIVRGLFDSVDRHTQRIHSTSRLAAVFDYHLVTRHAGKQYVSQRHNRQMRVSSDATWVEVTKRQFEHQQPPRTPHSYIMFPLSGSPKSKYHKAVVRVRGSEEKEWVFACSTVPGGSGGKACMTGHNLSRRSRLLGGEGRGRAKLLDVSLPPLLLEGYTHVVVSLPPHDKWVTVSVDVHGDTERRSSVATPRLLSSFTATPALPATPPRALRHELVLEGLNEPWHSYSVMLRPGTGCPVNGSAAPPQLWVTAHTSHRIARVPHIVDSGQFVYRVEQDEIALLPSPASDPSTPPTRGDLAVQLLLEPGCVYGVSVRASLPGACRRLLLLYGSQLPAFLLTQLLLALAGQLKSIGASRYCPSLIDSLLALTPMLVVPFVKLSAMVLYKLDIYNDQQLLSDLGIDLGVLPIFLFLSWMPLTLLLSAGVWLTVLAAGHAMHATAARIFGVSFGAGEVVVELALTGLSKMPAVVAVALLAIAFTTCGALSMALATVFYFMQLFDMYKDYIKKVILKMIPSLSEETPPQPATAAATTTPTNSTSTTSTTATTGVTSPNSTTSTTPTTEHPQGIVITRSVVPQSNESLALHLHLTLLMLCLVTSLLQAPTLLTWAIRMKQGAPLSADPTLWPSVTCLCSLAVLWQCSPRHGGRHYVLLGHAVHAAAVLTLIFASISVYKLPYVVAAILGAVAIHQVVTGATGFGTSR